VDIFHANFPSPYVDFCFSRMRAFSSRRENGPNSFAKMWSRVWERSRVQIRAVDLLLGLPAWLHEWAVGIPVLLFILLALMISARIGWTMLTTPAPAPLETEPREAPEQKSSSNTRRMPVSDDLRLSGSRS